MTDNTLNTQLCRLVGYVPCPDGVTGWLSPDEDWCEALPNLLGDLRPVEQWLAQQEPAYIWIVYRWASADPQVAYTGVLTVGGRQYPVKGETAGAVWCAAVLAYAQARKGKAREGTAGGHLSD